MKPQFLLLVFSFSIVKCSKYNALSQRLQKWHVLKQDDIRLHRQKRSIDDDDVVVPLDKQVNKLQFKQIILCIELLFC